MTRARQTRTLARLPGANPFVDDLRDVPAVLQRDAPKSSLRRHPRSVGGTGGQPERRVPELHWIQGPGPSGTPGGRRARARRPPAGEDGYRPLGASGRRRDVGGPAGSGFSAPPGAGRAHADSWPSSPGIGNVRGPSTGRPCAATPGRSWCRNWYLSRNPDGARRSRSDAPSTRSITLLEPAARQTIAPKINLDRRSAGSIRGRHDPQACDQTAVVSRQ